jgi:hypothetical protein
MHHVAETYTRTSLPNTKYIHNNQYASHMHFRYIQQLYASCRNSSIQILGQQRSSYERTLYSRLHTFLPYKKEHLQKKFLKEDSHSKLRKQHVPTKLRNKRKCPTCKRFVAKIGYPIFCKDIEDFVVRKHGGRWEDEKGRDNKEGA